ncbi:hypothetical protein ACC754_44670, partial [Rhizobium johnstonii]
LDKLFLEFDKGEAGDHLDVNQCTIGAFDVPKRKRAKLQKEKRRQRDRSRKEEQRRAAGALSRADYLDNSFSQVRPW